MSDRLDLDWTTVQQRSEALGKPSQIPKPSDFPNVAAFLDHLAELSLHPENSDLTFYCFLELSLELVARLIASSGQIDPILVFSALARNVGLHDHEKSAAVFDLILQYVSQANFLQKNVSEEQMTAVLVAYLRLVSHTPRFSPLLSTKVLNAIYTQSALQVHRWLAATLIVKTRALSSRKYQEMTAGLYPAVGDLDGSEFEFLCFELHEARRIAVFRALPQIDIPENRLNDSQVWSIPLDQLTSGIRAAYGTLVSAAWAAPQKDELVAVPSAVTTLKKLARCVFAGRPALVSGPPGLGKLLLVRHLHSLVQPGKLVSVHLNAQTDVKLLLGTYVSSHEPGKFVWKDGVLTRAVKEGKWVLIEDIDSASNEVVSVFAGLLESGTLDVSGSAVRAASGFQVIATVSVDKPDQEHIRKLDLLRYHDWESALFAPDFAEQATLDASLPRLIALNKFAHVAHSAPTPQELVSILLHRCETLSQSLPNDSIWRRLVALSYFLRNRIFSSRQFLALNGGITPKRVDTLLLVRLAQRADLVTSQDLSLSSLEEHLFSAAVDVYTGSISGQEARSHAISMIGSFLEAPSLLVALKWNPKGTRPEFSVHPGELIVGRHRLKFDGAGSKQDGFSFTGHALRLLEQLVASAQLTEPVLLSGETGCGKTAVVQSFAKLVGKKLVVLNLSQETEASDLVGGYKPVLGRARRQAVETQNEFLGLFGRTFNAAKNEKFITALNREMKNERFANVTRLWTRAVAMAREYLGKQRDKKRKLNSAGALLAEWDQFEGMISEVRKALNSASTLQFDFIEGSLAKAVRRGDWVLLDEVNLASGETLEHILDLLADRIGERRLLCTEKADGEQAVYAHSEFRLFACMNPSTDVGKKNLPPNIRLRFLEIYVESPDQERADLRQIVKGYLWPHLGGDDFTAEKVIDDVVLLYYCAKDLNDQNMLVDGLRNKIVVNIRVLSRALVFATDIARIYGIRRALFEAFSMVLLTALEAESEGRLQPLVYQYTIGGLKNPKLVLLRIPPRPAHLQELQAIQFSHYWLEKGEFETSDQSHYVITPFVEKNLMNLVRATLTKRFPILIQGPTSSGKTLMVTYLAGLTGNKVVRINNHEHTDLQEYLGGYMSDPESGKLVFQHGPLVEALKKGYWVILDELNLASSEVLEGINRLLDDNRELFLTETQETIRPHKNFMLFATQNPPGAVYGGRKFLLKAFRNRFLELNFDDIPQDELETILCNRCKIPPSYAKKIVEVYKELAIQRALARVFEAKNSFATLRDLFRWGLRSAVGYEELALNGYFLLAEKTRRREEKSVVKAALEKVMRVTLDPQAAIEARFAEISPLLQTTKIVWTKEMRKLAVLVVSALQNGENVLLVGETGCGKTTVCSALAEGFFKQELVQLNAHQNIETGDIIGAQRPVRLRARTQAELVSKISAELSNLGIPFSADCDVRTLINTFTENKDQIKDTTEIEALLVKYSALFEWADGPLVASMRRGLLFLMDEISLAEDAVLERLNSVLEPEKTIYLAERAQGEQVRAASGFAFLATMNPGGDYGKKELLPALRNRFTEIYAASMSDEEDAMMVVQARLHDNAGSAAKAIVKFSRWFGARFSPDGSSSDNGVVSMRDVLAWVDFVNAIYLENGLERALLDGVCMTFVDALGTNATAYLAADASRLHAIRLECIAKLEEFSGMQLAHMYNISAEVEVSESQVKIGAYSANKREQTETEGKVPFSLEAPTTAVNALRVLRAMVVRKPVLLEGDPGVGKSSLVGALAAAVNVPLTRINLSDQTDLIDLFGADAPAEGEVGSFAWRDAAFLRAMKRGEWVLLDEMNLALPALLEALNSVFDFRQQVYVPELDQTFECHKDFRVFAAQNPQYQGGGRKGLPKSFVNRFTSVYVGKLGPKDMEIICRHVFPDAPEDKVRKLIDFVTRLEAEVRNGRWGLLGGPWEFNIRDIVKFLQIEHGNALELVFVHKFRSESDKEHVRSLYTSVFGELPEPASRFSTDNDLVTAGDISVSRKTHSAHAWDNCEPFPLQCNIRYLESLFVCIEKAFPVLLVGPTLSGKSDLIRFAATSLGAKLVTFHVHSDVDTSDLVGGLDQYHALKELTPLVSDLQEYTTLLYSASPTLSDALSGFLDFLSELPTGPGLEEKVSVLEDKLQELIEGTNNSEFANFLERLRAIEVSASSTQFRFFDGILVEALQKGYWLHLSNINLVDSAIVDRLNSLTEANGVLVVEGADGTPRTIKPSPGFRLFLLLDPQHGDLSRAMRNRCAEIYLETLENRATMHDRVLLGLPAVSDDLTDSLNSLSLQRVALCGALVSSKWALSYQAATVCDIVCNSQLMSTSREYVSRAAAFFVPFERMNAISGLISGAIMSSTASNVEKQLFSQLSRFFLYLERLFGATLWTKRCMADLLFERIRALCDHFAFAELLESRRKSVLDRVFGLVAEILDFLSQNIMVDNEMFNEAVTELATIATLVMASKTPERLNFLAQESRDTIKSLLESQPDLSTAALKSLLDFRVENTRLMTRLWNHFVIGLSAVDRLVAALPESWKDFVVCKPGEVSLDLEKFQQANGISAIKATVFTENIAEFLRLVVAQRAAEGNTSLGEDFLMLLLMAGKKQLLLSGTFLGKNVKPYPVFLDELYSLWELGSAPFVSRLEKKIETLLDVPGSEHRDTIEALRYLGKETVLRSKSTTSDQLIFYKELLCRWAREVVLAQVEGIAHLEAALGNEDSFLAALESEESLGNVSSALASFYSLSQKLHEESSPEAIGRAFIHFGVGLVRMYLPSAPYDPALCEHILYELYTTEERNLNQLAAAARFARRIVIGDTEQPFELHKKTESVKEPRVARPMESLVESLYNEWRAFVDAFLGDSAVENILGSFAKPGQAERLVESLHKSTLRLVDNFAQSFSDYMDLNSVIKGAILGVNFGFALLALCFEPLKSSLDSVTNFSHFYAGSSDACAAVNAFGVLKAASTYSPSDLSVVHGVLLHSYVLWKKERLEREQKEREEGATYKFKEEEPENENSWKSLFPDFEDDEENEFVEPEQGPFISDVFASVFAKNIDNSLESIVESTKATSSASGTTLAGALACLVNKTQKALQGDSGADFYFEPNTKEFSRCLGLMEDVLFAVKDMLEEWPENATLGLIHSACTEVLSFKASTPLARLIGKLDQVHKHVNELVAYSRGVDKKGFAQLTLRITAMIVDWRRIELGLFALLAKKERATVSKSLSDDFFLLFELLAVSEMSKLKADETVQALHMFMSGSTQGLFCGRLDLLRAFSAYLTLSWHEQVYLLENVIDYYSQFQAQIEAEMEKVGKRLDKEINEVVLLASWKDVNIDALRESLRKLKRALYRVVRKYRVALGVPIRPLIETGLQFSLAHPAFPSQRAVKEFDCIPLKLEHPLWELKPAVLRSMDSFIPKLRSVGEKLATEEIPDLYEFCSSLLSEMERLRKATPTEPTEDNKKVINALKSEKRVLLSLTIKELKLMGLKTQEVEKYKLSATDLLAHGDFVKGEKGFARIIDLLPRMRAATMECADDVPREDISKGLAIAEHLVFSLFSIRSPLASAQKSLESVLNHVDLLSTICTEEVVLPSPTLQEREATFLRTVKMGPTICDFVCSVAQSSASLSGLTSGELVGAVSAFNTQLCELLREFSGCVEDVFTTTKVQLFERFEAIEEEFWKRARTIISSTPELGFVIDVLHEWKSGFNEKFEDVSLIGFDELLECAIDLAKSTTVAMQKMKTLVETELSEERIFVKGQQRVVAYLKGIHLEEMSGKFQRLLNAVSRCDLKAAVRGVVRYYSPLWSEYALSAQKIVKLAEKNHGSLVWGTYVLMTALHRILEQGFCGPQSTEEGGEDGSSGGGGLGDGETAGSKTNDDVEEEDLDEDALTANQDQGEKDEGEEEEEDKGVDIEGDMEGVNEDLEGGEDDGDKGDEAEDLEDEIDDLDDLDPNAVDDKMWDDEVDESKKEKESEQLPEDSKPDTDDMTAAEDKNTEGAEGGDPQESKEDEDAENENEENENDSGAEEEEDMGVQEDNVVQDDKEGEEVDEGVEQGDVLELPEDLNLDGDDDEKGEAEEDDLGVDEEGIEELNEEEVQDDSKGAENQEPAEEDGEDKEGESDVEMVDHESEENEGEDEEGENEEGEAEGEEKGEENEMDLQNEEKDENQNGGGGEDQETSPEDGGLDTADVEMQDAETENIDSAAKQSSGQQESGEDQEGDEGDASGGGGEIQAQKSESEKKSAENEEKLRDLLRQLGNSLDEFFKRSEEILDVPETEEGAEEKGGAEDPDQLQHVENALEHDKQALGDAEKDQAAAVDEEMQIDGEGEDDGEIGENEPTEENQEEDVNVDESKPNLETEGADEDKDLGELEEEEAEVVEKPTDKNEGEDEESTEGGKDKEYEDKEEISEDDGEFQDLESEVVDDDSTLLHLERNEIEPPIPTEKASELWRESEIATNELLHVLCEQLRLILQPTVSTKFGGDFKSGKRLNLKKIVSYIASDFKKDKIWLKRTKPSKRRYQIMISIDDSMSMAENPETVKLTYDTICLVSRALTQLETGDLLIVKFGEKTSVVHEFNRRFDAKIDGPRCFQWFGFADSVTNMKSLVENSVKLFNSNAGGDLELYRLEIVLSDGLCENHAEIARLVRRAKEERILIVFVILDGLSKSKESITDMSQVRYQTDELGNLKMEIDKYLDTFPFENYTIVDNIKELPEMICQILRAFFMSSV